MLRGPHPALSPRAGAGLEAVQQLQSPVAKERRPPAAHSALPHACTCEHTHVDTCTHTRSPFQSPLPCPLQNHPEPQVGREVDGQGPHAAPSVCLSVDFEKEPRRRSGAVILAGFRVCRELLAAFRDNAGGNPWQMAIPILSLNCLNGSKWHSVLIVLIVIKIP